MASTLLLNLPEVSLSQAQIDQVINDAHSYLERAFNKQLTVDFLGGNVTISEFEQTRNFFLYCKNVTTNRDLTLPSTASTLVQAERFITIKSDSTNSGNINIKLSGDPAVKYTLTPGGSILVFINGTNLHILGSYGLTSTSPSLTYDISVFISGKPAAGQIEVYRLTATQNLTFSANFSGSTGSSRIAATSDYIFDIRKNNVSIGTVNFPAGGGNVTFSTVGGGTQTLAPTDVLTVLSQNTSDATLEDVGITLFATKS